MFIHLHGSRELLAQRIAARKNHFMPPTLLDSQLATLEMPADGETFMTIAIDAPLEQQVAEATRAILGWKA
jgi:carbohydrate kinase (thermoresistant glucokinase family)